MKNRIIIILLFVFISSQLHADEGLWLPIFLNKYNIEDMQKKGFNLTAEDIYDVNKASMKDAVMIFGGGCTGELISNKGLLMTNHHCGFGQIQRHSSMEHDYLTDGFWAMNQEEELPNPGLTVTFLVYMEDVTTKILEGVTDKMTEKQRQTKIKANISKTIASVNKKHNEKYLVEVESFFQNNQYFVFVSQVFKDVRLVGAPPSAIGKFGGDTDNWMWPRHTGDFSLFRIYADANNEPAVYSPKNKPFKPKKFFPISLKGVQKGDFTLVFGYPGSTEEYIPSYAVELTTEVINPAKIQIRDAKLKVINKAMNDDRATRIKYASKQAGIANGWKKWQGENKGLKRLQAIKKKQELEKNFQLWAESDPNNEKYKNILPDYKKVYEISGDYELAYNYFLECCYFLETYKIATIVSKNYLEIDESSSNKQIDATRSTVIKATTNFYKNFDLEVDKNIFKNVIKLYYNGLDKKFHPKEYSQAKFSHGGDFDKYVDFIYENSIFLNQEKLNDFIDNYPAPKRSFFDKLFKKKEESKYSRKTIVNDPLYRLYTSYLEAYFYNILPVIEETEPMIDSLNRNYMAGLMEMQKDKIFYPDANFTLRVSYGIVDTYFPKDGVKYKYFTTLDGIIEKDNPEIYDYKVPTKLKELYNKTDYGQYADKDGSMHVCFIANNHTSGGNSGSPVINADGHLIGVNFDRCWEGTMSDIMFDPDQCRNITLDIRYALFIIDKLGGAGYLIDEMELVK